MLRADRRGRCRPAPIWWAISNLGVVPSDGAFAGFGDQAVVIVASALVLSSAVGESGVIGRVIRRRDGAVSSPWTGGHSAGLRQEV